MGISGSKRLIINAESRPTNGSKRALVAAPRSKKGKLRAISKPANRRLTPKVFVHFRSTRLLLLPRASKG